MQNVDTYLAWIEDVLVPYKNAKIAQLGLSLLQWTILKHDLHYTHKDPKVLARLAMHLIIPLFVPAKCTDELQECDTVVNKTFKAGVKAGFRDYLHELFTRHLARDPDSVASFNPTLTMTVLRPHLITFVETGAAALKTPAFRETIKQAFLTHGCFEEICSAQRQDEEARIALLAAEGGGGSWWCCCGGW